MINTQNQLIAYPYWSGILDCEIYVFDTLV